MTNPVAIDPWGCGCTECLTGEYVPLDKATEEQMRDLFQGRLRDNADLYWSIDIDGQPWSAIEITVHGGNHTFTVESIEVPFPVERYTLTASSYIVGQMLDFVTEFRADD